MAWLQGANGGIEAVSQNLGKAKATVPFFVCVYSTIAIFLTLKHYFSLLLLLSAFLRTERPAFPHG